MTLSNQDVTLLLQLLQSILPIDIASGELTNRLLHAGAIQLLHEDGSEPSIEALTIAAYSSPTDEACRLAYNALVDLARSENYSAIEALFTLAVVHNHKKASASIEQYHLHSTRPQIQLMYAALKRQFHVIQQADPNLIQLTAGFLQAPSELQNRLITAAEHSPLASWCSLVQALQTADAESFHDIVQSYHGYTQNEKACALHWLAGFASDGNSLAEDAVCQIALLYEDQPALALTQEHGWMPHDQTDKALFLFLTGQWDAYEVFDFNFSLLSAAYELASPSMRQRILAHSRQSGRSEWLQASPHASPARQLHEMSSADWQIAIRTLFNSQSFTELNRLAQAAPPVWAAAILSGLAECTSQPANLDPATWDRLIELARQVKASTALPLRRKNLHSPSESATCLALAADGSRIVVGSASQTITIWRSHDTAHPPLTILSPSPQTRAMAFSPSGEYLIAAGGDNAIRIFRAADGRLIKVLDGHGALVRAVLVLPDERTLLSAGFDGTLRAWRFPQGGESHILGRDTAEIFGMAISSNAQICLTAGANSSLRLRHLPDGAEIGQLEGHSDTVTHCATAYQSPLAASASRDQTLRLWNVSSRRLLSVTPLTSDPTTALTWHPGDRFVVCGTNSGTLTIFQPFSDQILGQLEAHRRALSGLAFSPDGQTLYSAGLDGEVGLWDFSPVLLMHQPPGSLPDSTLGELEKQNLPAARFVREILRWKHQFDIQIEHPAPIQIGEFDILL